MTRSIASRFAAKPGKGPRSRAISAEGLKSLRGLVNLKELDLQRCAIVDADLDYLRSLTRLRNLYLGGTEVTPDGAARLESAIPGLKVHL